MRLVLTKDSEILRVQAFVEVQVDTYVKCSGCKQEGSIKSPGAVLPEGWRSVISANYQPDQKEHPARSWTFCGDCSGLAEKLLDGIKAPDAKVRP